MTSSTAKARGLTLGKGEVWALVAALSYALNTVFSGVAVHGTNLNYLVGVTLRASPTFVLAAAAGWGMRRVKETGPSPLGDRRLAAALIGYGLLTFVIGGPLLFAALQEGGAVITSPVTGTQVLWAALIAAIFLHEPFNRRMAAGLVVSVAGIALLSAGKGGTALSPTWWLALPYATAAALCWSLSGVLIAYTMRRGVDRFRALAVGVFVGLVGVNAYLLLSGNLQAYVQTPPDVLLKVFIAGLLGAVALLSITSALAFTSVASANALNSLQVALAPVIAWIFVGEDLSGPMALGILIMLAGVLVVQRSRPPATEDPSLLGSD
jgi:drug/metabolite transporter, DME family